MPSTFSLTLLGVLALAEALPVTALLWHFPVAALPQLQLNRTGSSSFHHLLGLLMKKGTNLSLSSKGEKPGTQQNHRALPSADPQQL